MSTEGMMNIMRGQAAMALQQNLTTRVGRISGYNPAAYAVKVQFPPDDTETGWIPLGSAWVGNGWGMFSPPGIGDQCEVDFQDGGQDAPIGGLRLFDARNAPLSVPSGEMWLVHRLGATVRLTNDGKALYADGKGASVLLNGDGSITSSGAWTHQGTMHLTQSLHVDGQTTLADVTSNSHDVGSTHRHVDSGGNGIGGVPE